MWWATSASPSSPRNTSSRPSRSSSRGASASGSPASAAGASVVSADDNRLTPPACGDVLVLDALLQQHDALEERLGPRRAAGHVHVDGDELVDALGHGVRVPVGAAAVG